MTRADAYGLELERHPEFFEEAKAYEKIDPETGQRYTWAPGESLEEIAKPERLAQIRRKSAERRAVVPKDWTLASVLGDDEHGEQACLISVQTCN